MHNSFLKLGIVFRIVIEVIPEAFAIDRIKLLVSKYKWMKKRVERPIYYVGLYELFKIIEKIDLYSKILDELETLRTWIKEIVPIRNFIAHNVRVGKRDKQNAEIKAEYICNIIENSKN